MNGPSDFPDIPISPHKKFTKPNITQPLKKGDFCSFLAITPVWDLIETWGFCVDDPCDFPDHPVSPHKKFTYPNITQPLKKGDFFQFFGLNSNLGLGRDLGFSPG